MRDIKLELYYYTKVETLRYILKGANIYATNLQYMNDSEEYANGLKELREIINNSKEDDLITEQQLLNELQREPTSYSISFSAARDLLSQWSMYAGESGVSIKMRFDGNEKYRGLVLAGNMEDSKSEEREYLTEQQICPQKVFYCTKESMEKQEYEKMKKEVWQAIEETTFEHTLKDVQGNMVFLWKEMAPYVKRAEFRAEAEYRLVFDWTQLRQQFQIDYRNDKNVLKPYLDIECEGGWPIREIIVGPGFNQDVVYKSLLHFLNHTDLALPELTGYQYYERCSEYLKSCGVISEEVEKIWDKGRYIEKMDAKMRYKEFQVIRAEILCSMKVNDSFKNLLEKQEITKDGIILSKSRIPYVF